MKNDTIYDNSFVPLVLCLGTGMCAYVSLKYHMCVCLFIEAVTSNPATANPLPKYILYNNKEECMGIQQSPTLHHRQHYRILI